MSAIVAPDQIRQGCSSAVPEPGQLVEVRRRQWVVGDVQGAGIDRETEGTPWQHLVNLTSIDEDALGEELDIVWEIEPGARVLEKAGLPRITGHDDADRLEAFLDAVSWGAATNADRSFLQAPFRSGVTIEDYQLDPLVRAIDMARVNLLIADDVGLGKTIEAGLVIQELLVRHRARTVLIVCPASLQVKWQTEMHEKFGLEFRIVDTDYIRRLLRDGGNFGLLAVNTIAEGDTRQGGLEWMTRNGATIYAAYPNEPWPGKAAVVTSRVHVHRGEWTGARILSGRSVSFVSAFLSDQEEWSPKKLKANEGKAFIGSFVNGMGFVLSHDEAQRMLDADPRNAEVIFPYLNGEDVNSDPEQRASRWVINFWDWPEEKAATYREPYAWVKERVYPERLEKSKEKSYRNIMSMWWQHWNVRPGLYHAIGRGATFCQHPDHWDPAARPLARVLVVARVSKTLAFALVDPTTVFSDQIVAFAFGSAADFALFQSSLHGVFAWQHSSKLKSDLRYSPSDAFETFPLPGVHDPGLEELGDTFHALRSEIMRAERVGLTRLYRRFHDPDEADQHIQELRTLQVRIDEATALAYGWDDLHLDHGFHSVTYLPENDRVRFTISEPARLEVLRRLSDLNRQRYEEEVTRGLRENATRRSSARAPRTRRGAEESTQATLDLGMPSAATASAGDSVVYAASANESDYLEAAESRARYTAVSAAAILDFLRSARGWHAKSDIVAATGLSDGQWNTLIADLVARGLVERQGERRGARYRLVE